MKRYQVRTKKFERKSWKVVDSFDTMKEALQFAIRSEYAQRHTENEFDKWEVKDTLTGNRFSVA